VHCTRLWRTRALPHQTVVALVTNLAQKQSVVICKRCRFGSVRPTSASGQRGHVDHWRAGSIRMRLIAKEVVTWKRHMGYAMGQFSLKGFITRHELWNFECVP